MTNFGLRVPALLYVLSSVTTACAWSEARPTLVLQLSRVERARTATEGTQRVQEFVLSASISMAVDEAEVESPTRITADGTSPERFDSWSSNPFELGCEQSPTLCAWAYSAEEAAVLALVESHGAEL